MWFSKKKWNLVPTQSTGSLSSSSALDIPSNVNTIVGSIVSKKDDNLNIVQLLKSQFKIGALKMQI
jgi:hypothetical protein